MKSYGAGRGPGGPTSRVHWHPLRRRLCSFLLINRLCGVASAVGTSDSTSHRTAWTEAESAKICTGFMLEMSGNAPCWPRTGERTPSLFQPRWPPVSFAGCRRESTRCVGSPAVFRQPVRRGMRTSDRSSARQGSRRPTRAPRSVNSGFPGPPGHPFLKPGRTAAACSQG